MIHTTGFADSNVAPSGATVEFSHSQDPYRTYALSPPTGARSFTATHLLTNVWRFSVCKYDTSKLHSSRDASEVSGKHIYCDWADRDCNQFIGPKLIARCSMNIAPVVNEEFTLRQLDERVDWD